MKFAVVTGASSGIGKAFCRFLDQQGYQLLLVARREDRLLQLKQTLQHASIFVADLSQLDNCYRLYDHIKDRQVDLFINNAGFGDCGSFIETDFTKEQQMLDVNIRALHVLMKLVLKQMVRNDHGKILNVASCAGLLPGGPYMATYYATKAYVTSLTQAVAKELKDQRSQVYVGCLCPGPVDTEFNQVANVEFALSGITAKACASYALKMIEKGKTVIVPGLMIKIASLFSRFLPRKLCLQAIAHQQKKKLYKKI